MSTPEDLVAVSRLRRVLEAIIRVLDITISAALIGAGLFAILATPLSVIQTIHAEGLVYLWGGLLIVGGVLSGTGRTIGVWLFETVGLALSIAGIGIYIAILSLAVVPVSLGSVVALILLLVALLSQARRFVELQIFTSEEQSRSWIVKAILRIRGNKPLIVR